MAIQYGQGSWKDEYDDRLDQLKGKRARLGKDWWTTLDTSLKLDFGGVTVPPGSYFLGLQCDQDAKFALALLDANKAMAASAMPFLEKAWKIWHRRSRSGRPGTAAAPAAVLWALSAPQLLGDQRPCAKRATVGHRPDAARPISAPRLRRVA